MLRRLLVALLVVAPLDAVAQYSSAPTYPTAVDRCPGGVCAGSCYSRQPRRDVYAEGIGAIPVDIRLDRSGFDASGMPRGLPAGFPVPDIVWSAASPTANLRNAAQTFTVSASAPTAVGVPYCLSGDYDGVDEMDGRCNKGLSFVAASSQKYTGGDYANPASGSISVCALARLDYSATEGLAGQNGGAGTQGWTLWSNVGNPLFTLRNDAGVNTNASAPLAKVGWGIICGTASVANGVVAYANGVAGAGVAYPGGTVNPAGQTMLVGQSVPAGYMNGDVAFVWVWLARELSAGNVKAWSQAGEGTLQQDGTAATVANAGPVGYWVDGKIDTASDDMPLMGQEQPPGLTGAGSPSSGMGFNAYLGNSALYSRQCNIGGWTAYAGGSLAAGSVSPFRDGRGTCSVSDTDVGSAQGMYQVLDISALNTGDKITWVIYAAADDDNQWLDVRLYENTVCAGSFEEVTGASVTRSWKQYSGVHTVADGTCTKLNVYVFPIQDRTVVGTTGKIYPIVQVYQGVSQPPSIYCETAAATVACGGDALSYTMTQPLVSATGTIVGTQRMSVDWTPLGNDTATSGWIVNPYADANNRWVFYGGMFPIMYWLSQPPGAANYLTDSSALAPGTTYHYDLVINYDLDRYQLRRDGKVVATATNALASPAGLTTLYIGSNATGTGQLLGGQVIRNVRFYR